jgi:hypothetical protein
LIADLDANGSSAISFLIIGFGFVFLYFAFAKIGYVFRMTEAGSANGENIGIDES